MICAFFLTLAAVRTSRMFSIAARKIVEDDRCEKTGCRTVRGVQRGGSSEGVEKLVRASQGVRREGKLIFQLFTDVFRYKCFLFIF